MKNINNESLGDGLLDAIGDIGDDIVAEAASFKVKTPILYRKLWITAAVLICTLALFGGAFYLGGRNSTEPPEVPSITESETSEPAESTENITEAPEVTESGIISTESETETETESESAVTEPQETTTAVIEPVDPIEPAETTAYPIVTEPATEPVTEPTTEPHETIVTQAPETPVPPTLPPPSTVDPTPIKGPSSGMSSEYVIGKYYSDSSISEGAPFVQFDIGTTEFAVKAKVVKTLPDTYYRFNEYDSSYTVGYRVMLIETIEALYGEGIPHQFYFVLKNGLYTDMTVYDFLFISMEQIGTDGYVMTNASDMTTESFPLPVFRASTGNAEFGKIIAFKDGIFDESLWQNSGWINGYQFAKLTLDYMEENPDSDTYSFFEVKRGCTEEYTLKRIRRSIDGAKRFPIPKVLTLSELIENNPEVISYVTNFENGVFAQYYYGKGAHYITFQRYINGCRTEEIIKIHLKDNTVQWSEIRYSVDEFTNLPDITEYIKNTAKAYKESPPMSPHVSPEDKSLRTLSIDGRYFKYEGKIYGVVRTKWFYSDTNWDEGYTVSYIDETFVLFEAGVATYREITREELSDMMDSGYVYVGDYGPIKNGIIYD